MALLRSAYAGVAGRNSHALVVHEIGRAIVAGEHEVGSILPGDSDLAERFGVSRTVLREAMKTLSAKGMLVARARVGTRVTERDSWNMFDADVLGWYVESGADLTFLDHLCDMRLAFEPAAASLAARRATSAESAQILACAEAMRLSALSHDFAMADLAFHTQVLGASHNPFMSSLGALIDTALMMSFELSSPAADPSRRAQSAADHASIAESIARNDGEAAAEAMRWVILDGRAHLARNLAAGLSDP